MLRTWLFATFAVLAGHLAAVGAEWKRLQTPADLAATAADRAVTILDIRSSKAFRKGHIPGALNAPYGTWRGPKDNPGRVLDDVALTERLQSLGLTRQSRVVVTYAGRNPTDFGSAARVYWTLKSAGLGQIAILNGGIRAWQAAGRPLSQDAQIPERSTERFALSDEWMMDRDGVRAVVDGSANAQIIDARPLEFLQGKQKHKQAKAAGTIEGAANITHSTWFDKGKAPAMTGADQVRRLARAAGVEDGTARPIASFCNTGHWAATNWFALSELAGIANVKLYPESMVGWTQADQPVVTQP